MMGKGKKIQTNLRIETAVLLVLSFSTFALPREFFDPHVGTLYDIYCQLTSYIVVDLDELKITPILEIVSCKRKNETVSCECHFITLIYDYIIRPPPYCTVFSI